MSNPASDPRLAADRHDAFLVAMLGAVSALQRLERACVAPGPGGTLPADDPVVLATLGALSLGRSLRRWLAEASSSPTPGSDTPPVDSRPRLRELIR